MENLREQNQSSLYSSMDGRTVIVLVKLKSFLKSLILLKIVARPLARDVPFDPKLIRSILVLRFDRIGDMVVTTPFLAQLREIYPEAVMSVLCSKVNEPVIRYNPNVQGRPILSPGSQGFRLLMSLRNKFDLVIDLNHSVIWRDLLMIRLLNPTWAASVFKEGRYGIEGKSLKLFRLMPERDCSPDTRITRKYLHLGEYLGGKARPNFAYEVFLSKPPSERGSAGLCSRVPRPFWIINQHGGRPQMSLKQEDIREAIDILLAKNHEHHVVWVSAPATHQQVRDLTLEWFGGNKRVHAPPPTDSVLDVAAMIEKSLGIVTPDTSLVHFAAAFSRPSVIVFADEPELYAQWAPRYGPWTRHLFSGHSKSLEGYDSNELMSSIREMVELTAVDPATDCQLSEG